MKVIFQILKWSLISILALPFVLFAGWMTYLALSPHFVETARQDAAEIFRTTEELSDLEANLLRGFWRRSPLESPTGRVLAKDRAGINLEELWYSLPCSTYNAPEWFRDPKTEMVCFERVVPRFGDPSDEYAILCYDAAARHAPRWAVGHFDMDWGTGTWEGRLLPEDYHYRGWCAQPVKPLHG